MRQIINISLPAEVVKMIKEEVKTGGYASTSEFFRHLLRLWNSHKLLKELEEAEKEFKAGKGKILKSLKDLR